MKRCIAWYMLVRICVVFFVIIVLFACGFMLDMIHLFLLNVLSENVKLMIVGTIGCLAILL